MLARRSRVPIVFTGLGMEDVQGTLHRGLLRWVLNQADAIGARDPLASQTMQKLGVTTPITVTADWAFQLPGRLPPAIGTQLETLRAHGHRELIGVNLRDEKSGGPERETRQHLPYREKLVAALTGLLRRTSAAIGVVSMTQSRKTDDHAFALRIRDAIPAPLQSRFVVFPPDLNPAQIKGVIGQMDIFISTRLHPTIFAVSEGVPTLAIHDLLKVRGFMEHCGLHEFFLSLDNTDPETLVASALDMLGHRAAISQRIESRRPTMDALVAMNIKLIDRQIVEQAAAKPR
jgi:polysaccharide pyruvyl transferase WcaK-like protein